MCNELGISREDIERWTKEAVAHSVEKLVGQMNIQEMVDRKTKELVEGNNWNGSKLREEISKAVAANIVNKIKLSV